MTKLLIILSALVFLPSLTNYAPQTAASPGIEIATTIFDFQSNGSMGNRCAADSEGGVHFTWMDFVSWRRVYYAYVDTAGNWLGPTPVSQNGGGYPQISVTTEDLAAITYHSAAEDYVMLAIDNFPGFGIFNYYDPPDMLDERCYWPYVSVDRNNVIHIICTENPPNAGDSLALGYTNSADTGLTWSNLVPVDTLMTISAVNVASSPVSNKSAIIYTHPLNYDTQWENDIYYIESQDGLTWDWANGKTNVTDYGPPDSLYAFADLAAIYDYNDNLHIIWNAQWVTDTGVRYETFLLHFDRNSGVITEMHASYDTWDNCSLGTWNRPICKMSLGVSEQENSLIAVYTAFDTSDCSAAGFANGDIYMQYSCDNGSEWTNPENLTDSPTPGCLAGQCESDHWSSVADRVNDSFHIIYIEDKDAGAAWYQEGQVTTNPIRYLEVGAPECITGIDPEEDLPVALLMYCAYPNPFNAKTTIEFALAAPGDVELVIYDITGARVVELVNAHMLAGEHSVEWDATGCGSGIYFAKMSAGMGSKTLKMVMIK